MTSPNRSAFLFAPVDISFLVFFRVFFAGMMLWTVAEFFAKGLIASIYIEPAFHFTYHGFEWLQPWPGQGMYAHFAGLAIIAFFVLVGFLYRLSALLLFLGFTYVFLLEKAIFLNHYFLMCLISGLLVFLPAHRAWSVDALLRPSIRASTVPAWSLWVLRFQIALPYFYGGLAKLNSDWLQGQPMQMWLMASDFWPGLVGETAGERWFALLFSWGGLLFDLSIVPLLLWRRTRTWAFAAAILFHLMNAFMFDIGVFPWLMIGATTVFFAPDWPRHVLTSPKTATKAALMQTAAPSPNPLRSRAIVCLLALFVVVQLLVPLRRFLYPGNGMWTEQGYLFSWQMMLWQKVNAVRIVVINRATGEILPLDIPRWLTRQQFERMGNDPEMLREFAWFLRAKHAERGRDVAVRMLVLSSLNGRRPQPLVDPTVDLSRESRRIGNQPYVRPLLEPFRWPPWDVPVPEWERVLSQPRAP